MIRLTHRLSNTELAMIQAMRDQSGYSEFDLNIDTSVESEVIEAYRHDSRRYFGKLLAARARLYCKEKLRIDEKTIHEHFWHAATVGLVALLVLSAIALVAGLTIGANFFNAEKGSASVLAIFWLVALTALPIVLPVLSVLSLLIHRSQKREKTGLATVVITFFRTIRRVWCKLAMRLGLIEEADPNAITKIEEMVRSHSYFGSAGAVFITNLYFLIVALVVWSSVYYRLSTRQIDFFYQDSTSHIESRQKKIHYVAAPVRWLTSTPAPSENAIAWAGGDWVLHEPKIDEGRNAAGSSEQNQRTRAEAAKSISARMTQGFRVEWSRFLLALVLTYVFFPRLIVAAVSLVLACYYRRDFVPKQTERECRKIVDSILHPPFQSETIHRKSDPESEPNIPDGEFVETTINDPKTTTDPPVPDPNPIAFPPVAKPTRRSGQSIKIVAVGSNPGLPRVVAELVSEDNRFAAGGVLRSARDRGEFKKQLAENDQSNLVLIFSLLEVPAQNMVEFLKAIASQINVNRGAEDKGIAAVLSDGAETRVRLNNDLKLFQNRVQQWRSACVQCGVSPERIYDVDVSTALGTATCRSLIAGPPTESGAEPVKRMAGKYMVGVGWLRVEFARMFDKSSSSESWDRFATDAMQKIDSIYEEECMELHRFFDAKVCSDSLKQVVKNVELPPGVLPEQLEQFAKVGEFMKSLSPRWIGAGAIAGASLCLGGGVALVLSAPAFVPLLTPFVAGSAMLSAVTGGGLGQWLKSKTSTVGESRVTDDVPDCLQINTTSILQMSILKILILEFQGSSEKFISNQIGKEIEKLGVLVTAEKSDVDSMLVAFQSNLDEVRKAI